MTKTYDLVTLYYKGHSPIKKEDTSFLLCLYTMLFVLFAMVAILLFFTFFNVRPIERGQVYVHEEPQQQRLRSGGSTTKLYIGPTATPSVHYDDNYEETAKPIINWDHVVDFFVGSEEDTSQQGPTYSLLNVEHGRTESSTANVFRYTEEENPDQIPSGTPASEEHTKKGSAIDVEDSSKATEAGQNGSEAYPKRESTTKTPSFVPEDLGEATRTSKTPITSNERFEFGFEHLTKASEVFPVPKSTNHEPEFDSPSTTKGSPHVSSAPKESKTIVEDTEVATKALKHPKFPPIEEDFNEWPEEETIRVTTTTPIKKELNEDVEWVQDFNLADKTEHLKVQKDCKSSRCELAASKMLSSINLSAEPCVNFYNFACGGIATRKERIEPKLISEDSSSDLNFVTKFKKLYKSCLEHENYFEYHDRIKRTRTVLNDIGMLNFNQDQGDKDITEVIANLTLLDAMPLFNVDIDVANSTFILKLIPPDRTLSSKHWSPLGETRRNCLRNTQPENYQSTIDITFLYYDYQECQGNYKDYLKSLKTSIEELGNFGKLNSTEKKENIQDVVEFVGKSLLPIMDQDRNLQEIIVHLEYVTMNSQDLIDQFPFLNWPKFFEVISSNDSSVTTYVQVYDKEYFEVLFKKLSLFETDTLIKSLSAILTEKYYQEVVLPTPKHSRAKYCSKFNKKILPDISHYLQQKFEFSEDFEERKQYISSLFFDMKRDVQNSLEWLDEKSRTSMKNKISNLELEMSEDYLYNEYYMEEFYSKFNIENGDYSRNYYEATKFRRKAFLFLHSKPVTLEDIFRNFIDNSKEDPVFFYGHNKIYIPDGLVQKTFMDFPKYLIVSKIGFPLAKVIGHALDPIGLEFGVNLSENITSIYDKFVQESRRSLPHHLSFNKLNLVFNLNSRISEVERIVENTAMALVTRTIEEIQYQPLLPLVSYTFSREKIFFIALVQEFCTDKSFMEFIVEAHENAVLPPQFIVQNILQNSEVFHDEFSCRRSGKMIQFPYLSKFVTKETDKIT